MTNSGVIYIVRIPNEPINYYKVGRSSNSASERIRTGQTWMSEDIEIIKEFEVVDTVLAEAAAHRSLNSYKIRSEIFECDIEILIGKVKESISPWLSSENIETILNPWMIKLIKEYEFCPTFNCGLCRVKTQKFINELLMRSQTTPLGLGPEERVIHQEYTSKLIRHAKIGNIIEEGLKTVNLSDLLEVTHWRDALNYLFSLDAKSGSLEFNDDYPPLPNSFESRQQWQRISLNGRLKICINGFNINQVIEYWCNNNLYKYLDLLLYCTQKVKIETGFVEGALVNITEQVLKYFEENITNENVSVHTFSKLGNNLMGNINRLDVKSVSYGDKDLNMKQKLQELFIERQNIEQRRIEEINRERQELYEEIKEIEIQNKAKHLNISFDWSTILVNFGDDSSSIGDEYFIEDSYFATRFSRRYDIKNIDIIIYARDYEVSLEQAVWFFYKIEEKKFNKENQIKQLQRKELVEKKKAKKLRRFEAFQKRSFYIWLEEKEQKKKELLRIKNIRIKHQEKSVFKELAIFVAMFFAFIFIFS